MFDWLDGAATAEASVASIDSTEVRNAARKCIAEREIFSYAPVPGLSARGMFYSPWLSDDVVKVHLQINICSL